MKEFFPKRYYKKIEKSLKETRKKKQLISKYSPKNFEEYINGEIILQKEYIDFILSNLELNNIILCVWDQS